MSNPEHTLQVVTVKGELRCVYVNDHRIVGPKPWASECGVYQELRFKLSDLRSAFPMLDIAEKGEER